VGTVAGTGEVGADPVYLSGSDYHLQTGSPAIDAGTDAAAVTLEDFAGGVRPADAGWDLGCYEYGALAATPQILQWQEVDPG
jgi:hypothetical protein